MQFLRESLQKRTTMHIDDALLAKLEKLAMIELGEDKKESTKAQLQEIMDFVGNLEKHNRTSGNIQRPRICNAFA